MYENIASHASTSETEETKKKIQVDKRTKAEIAFEKSKEKKVYQNNQYIAVPLITHLVQSSHSPFWEWTWPHEIKGEEGT